MQAQAYASSNLASSAFARQSELRRTKSAYIGRDGEIYMYYVYILLCGDGKPYTGCTDDLKDRKRRHDNGLVAATKDRLPAKLICYFAFSSKYTAFNFEKYLKSGSGRAFIKKHSLVGF
jgi:putative endonuclease